MKRPCFAWFGERVAGHSGFLQYRIGPAPGIDMINLFSSLTSFERNLNYILNIFLSNIQKETP